jgi:hypothetical protein
MAPDILHSVFEFLFLVPSFFATRRTWAPGFNHLTGDKPARFSQKNEDSTNGEPKRGKGKGGRG